MNHRAGLPCHPATALLLWLFFVVWLNRSGLSINLLAGVAMCMLLWHSGWRDFLAYVRRTRILLVMIWLARLMEQGMPGGWRAWQQLPWRAANLECLHWVVMLAALAAVLSRLSRLDLLAGLRLLLQPFAWLGLSVDRVAVRLWLTLEYADELLHVRHNLRQRLHTMMEMDSNEPVAPAAVALSSHALRLRDAGCILVGILLLRLVSLFVGE